MLPQTKKLFPITRDDLKVTRIGANGPMVDDIIRRLESTGRVLLLGAHGSGKTTVAADAAIKLREQQGTEFHFVHTEDWIEHPEPVKTKDNIGLLIIDEASWLQGAAPEHVKEFEQRLLDLEKRGIEVIVIGHNPFCFTELSIKFFGDLPRHALFYKPQILYVPATFWYEEARELLTRLKEMGIEFSQDVYDAKFEAGKDMRYIVLAMRVLTELTEEDTDKPISLEKLDDLIRRNMGQLFAVFDDFVDSFPRNVALRLLYEPLRKPSYLLHENVLMDLTNYSCGNINPLFLEFARLKLAELGVKIDY